MLNGLLRNLPAYRSLALISVFFGAQANPEINVCFGPDSDISVSPICGVYHDRRGAAHRQRPLAI